MLNLIKKKNANYIWIGVIKKHYSRMGRILAPKYTEYLRSARKIYRGNLPCNSKAELSAIKYLSDGFSSYWDINNRDLAISMLQKLKHEENKFGEKFVWDAQYRYCRGDIFQKFPEVESLLRGQLGLMIERIFEANFKIFYGIMYKSVGIQSPPSGSQLWHSDGGPGTCMNIMFCLNPTDESNGAMEFIPWELSVNIFSKEREFLYNRNRSTSRVQGRDDLCNYYQDEIEQKLFDQKVRLVGDSGLAIAFRNNTIHRGGYPAEGKFRYACIFHVYPSVEPTPWETYRNFGVGKISGYPDDPAF